MNVSIFKRKLNTTLKNPRIILIKALYKISPILNDEVYLKILFPLKMGYPLNLNEPKTFNEKLQWLKINYRKPIMTQMVDKYESKKYSKRIIGEEFIIKSYGVWNCFDEIDFDSLPDKFVLKTTHDQGGVVVVHNKNFMDKNAVKKKLNKHLNLKHYYLTREWPYKNVKPRIMAEQLLSDNDSTDLYDYKFLCFHGVPKIWYVAHGRNSETTYYDFYNMDGTKLNLSHDSDPISDINFMKPQNFDLMVKLATKLSEGHPHLRVDFYNIQGRIYLGELTFFVSGGMGPFDPIEWDYQLGNWINTGQINYNRIDRVEE